MDNFNHTFFAGAETPYETAQYVIFGVPYDGTCSFLPGTRRGPQEIRRYTWNFEDYLPEYDLDFWTIPACDLGDIEPSSLPETVVSQVEEIVSEIAADGKIPILLGGEHSVSVGAVRALKPEAIVVCDAHLDLRDEFGGTPYNHACATRRFYDDGVFDITIIGARSGIREEFSFARDHLSLYTAEDVRKQGIAAILDEVTKRLAGKRVYLSIDADAIDCCLTPGLGTPEPFGLTPLDIRAVVQKGGPLAVGFDYMEVCPIDHGQAATVAGKLIMEFLAVHATSHNITNSSE